MRGRNWDHFYSFLLSFSFLNPKVKNYNNTHKCSLRNQKDILDNPIPCKSTLLVYSLWNTNWRHDPTYAPQYKSKHSNYVKLSNLLLKLLDTHSWYPDRECSLGGLLMLSLPKDIKIVFLGRNEHSKISCNYLWRDTSCQFVMVSPLILGLRKWDYALWVCVLHWLLWMIYSQLEM